MKTQTLEQDMLWYVELFSQIRGFTPEQYAKKTAFDLSRKHAADPRAIFDAVYAAITSKEQQK